MTTSTADSVEILIVAAEASSALYAQRLLEHWQQSGKRVKAFGIGSRAMEKLGFECLGRSEELAVVGVSEVLAHWPEIKAAFHGLLAAAKARRPRLALLLDYPDFNLRLAKKLKAQGVQVVYYISPQIWAWRQGRVNLIRRVIDHLLVVFPFEVDFYQRHQVSVEFVGHPLLDELAADIDDEAIRQRQRQRFGVSDGDLLLGLMPGSRRSELKHHLKVQVATTHELRKKLPQLKVALLVAPNFSLEEVRAELGNLDLPLMLIKDEPFRMIQMADVVLCASGTATLMVGLVGRPMVIMYRMSALTAWLARRLVKSTAHFGLINLVMGRRVVPERFQSEASPELLATELEHFLVDPELRRRVHDELLESRKKLGDRGATKRVAVALERLWSHP